MRGRGQNHQRKDGLWQASVKLPGGKRQYVYGASQREVNEKKKALKAKNPVAIELGKQTVGEYLTLWFAGHRANLEPRTIDDYWSKIQLHIKPRLRDVPLGAINSFSIAAFYAALYTEDKKSPRIRLGVHQILSVAFRPLIKKGVLPADTFPDKAPKYKAAERKPWTAKQLLHFFEVTKGDRLHALYRIAAAHGPREAELLALGRNDITLDARSVNYNKAVKEVTPFALDPNGEFKGKVKIVGQPKTLSRVVGGLTDEDVAAIREHYKLLLKEGNSACEYVFCSRRGKLLSKSVLLKAFKRAIRKAGLPDIHFHDLRHTNGTLLIEAGAPEREVQRRLGHKTSAMTKRYTHTTANMAEAGNTLWQAILQQGVKKEEQAK